MATALALGLTGVLGPAAARPPSTIRTVSFTLVSNQNGTATLTINPKELLDAAALQNDLQQDGIPAMVTSGSFCSSDPAGDFQPSPGRAQADLTLINTNSYTCTSTPPQSPPSPGAARAGG